MVGFDIFTFFILKGQYQIKHKAASAPPLCPQFIVLGLSRKQDINHVFNIYIFAINGSKLGTTKLFIP